MTTDREGSSQLLDLLDLPSLTTVAFIAIVIMAYHSVVPIWGVDAPLWILIIYAGLPTLVTLRTFLATPDRWIREYDMGPLTEQEPELAHRVEDYASQMGMRRCPTLLVTSHPTLSIQCFGSFRRQFIVVNRREIDAAKEPEAREKLDTMFIHELAHIKHGDNWKFRLAQHITSYFMVYAILVSLMVYVSAETWEIFFEGNPVSATGRFVVFLLYPLIMGAQAFTMKLLGEIREYYADARAAQMMGRRAVLEARTAADRFWSQQPAEGAEKRGTNLPLARKATVQGLGFLGKRQLARYRQETLGRAPVFHRSIHWTIFVSGFAVGISWFSLNRALYIAMYTYTTVLVLLFGVLYLVPYVSANQRSLKPALIVPALMMAGLYSSLLLFLFSMIFRYAVTDALYALWAEIKPMMIAAGVILLNGLLITLTFLVTVPFIRHLKQAKLSGILATGWRLRHMTLPISFAAGVYTLLSVPMRSYDASNFVPQAIGLAVTLILVVGLFGLIRWGGRKQHHGEQ